MRVLAECVVGVVRVATDAATAAGGYLRVATLDKVDSIGRREGAKL